MEAEFDRGGLEVPAEDCTIVRSGEEDLALPVVAKRHDIGLMGLFGNS